MRKSRFRLEQVVMALRPAKARIAVSPSSGASKEALYRRAGARCSWRFYCETVAPWPVELKLAVSVGSSVDRAPHLVI